LGGRKVWVGSFKSTYLAFLRRALVERAEKRDFLLDLERHFAGLSAHCISILLLFLR
jgi:hypothetical protein